MLLHRYNHTVRVCDSHPAIDFAAAELKHYLDRILAPGAAQNTPREMLVSIRLELACTADIRELLQTHEIDVSQFDSPTSEAFAIVATQENVLFCGARPRAVLYAVYDFLEREANCVFAMPGRANEYVPRCDVLEIKEGGHYSAPAFPIRGYGFHGTHKAPFDLPAGIDWMCKNRFNRPQIGLDRWIEQREELAPLIAARDLDLDLGVHSLPIFLPEIEYFTQHPEWFASASNRHGRQLRYANHDSIPELARNILGFLEHEPLVKVLGLWPLDGTAFEPEEIADGRFGATLLRYVNALAEQLSAVRPDMAFDHLAYVGYAAPPKQVKPHASIVTSVCHYWDENRLDPVFDAWFGRARMSDDDRKGAAVENFHPHRDHRRCCEDLRGWIDIGKTIVFTYYTDTNLGHYHVFDLSQKIRTELKFYQALGVLGCLDCFVDSPIWLWTAREQHALARHLWDPDCDWESHDRRLLQALFGQAAPAMQGFYSSLRRLHQTPLYCGYRLSDALPRGLIVHSLAGYQPVLHDAVLVQIEQLFHSPFAFLEAALEASTSEVELERVRALRANLARQRAQAVVVVHGVAMLEYMRIAARLTCDERAMAIADASRMLGYADEVHRAWETTERPLLPDWYEAKHKSDAYREFIEEKRGELAGWLA